MYILCGILLLLTLIFGIAITIKPGINKKTGEPYKRKDMGIRFGIMAVLFLILTIAFAPSKPSNAKPVPTVKSTASTSAKTAAPPKAAAPAATVTPATQPSTPTNNLTGFGATQDNWNKTHTADPTATANSSYDRGQGTSDCSNFGDRYYGMVGTSNYSMCFPSGQTLATTQAEVMKEFPSDVAILWQGKQTSGEPDECYQMEVHSATLASALGTDGDALVEFQTLDPSNTSGNIEYLPSNVNDAMLTAEDNASLSVAPGC
ncbi:MAG TPA: hypothetical protein VMB52_06240 [Verrucomicrobiae bacterium]|nr:hypothetical protein [Verrucomicrobiae bacterium]